MKLREIQYGSDEYVQEKALREAVLRTPLGLVLTEDDIKDDPYSTHFGAFNASNELIACILLHPIDINTAQLRQMAVQSSIQKQGLGRSLVEYFEKQAMLHHYRVIQLNARITAQGFYEKLGYTPVDQPFTHMTLPHIKMQKIL